MNKNIFRTMMLGTVFAFVMTCPCFAQEAASEEPVTLHGNTVVEYEDGILTIRIEATDHDDPDLWWQFDRDFGESTGLVDVLTDTTEEEGLAYAGSFMGTGDGEDTIRLVYTDGFIVDQYMDFTVKVEDGKILETTGGGQALPTRADDLLAEIGGLWVNADDPNTFMELEKADGRGLAVMVSDGSGQDGMTCVYTMTAYCDAVTESLLYRDGTLQELAITDGSETAADDETELAAEGVGTGEIAFEQSEDGAIILLWTDGQQTGGETIAFVKSEE